MTARLVGSKEKRYSLSPINNHKIPTHIPIKIWTLTYAGRMQIDYTFAEVFEVIRTSVV